MFFAGGARDFFSNECAGGVCGSVFAVGAGGEESDIVAVAELREGGEGKLLIAAAFAADGFVCESDGGFAAANEAIGTRLGAHSEGHLGEMAADFFGCAFGVAGGDHGV